MKLLFASILAIHGLIHLMGFAKAFGLAELPALTRAISRPVGALWLLAAALLMASAFTLHAAPRAFWLVGAIGVALSQIVIVTSWSDARFGTLANVVAVLGVAYSFFTRGPQSLHAEYLRDAAAGLRRASPAQQLVTEADLAPLPPPVQRYLRLTGSVGQPRVRSFRVTFRGRIRAAADAPWMDLHAEQTSFVEEPTRLFYMEASRAGVPAVGYHRYVGADASMRVRVLGLISAVDLRGVEFSRTETVTLFNDMCVLAPATLIDRAITWQPVDERTVRARFAHAGHTVGAELAFDERGQLVDFISDDRPALAPDGRTLVAMRWSTPLRAYKSFGARRVAAEAEAVYHPASGTYSYAEFEIVSVAHDVAP